jgi:hypothetical protein
MNLDVLEDMDRDGLQDYIRSLLWQFRLCDAFWFLKVEEAFGQDTAEDINARVWAKAGELCGRDIVERFGPFSPGVRGFFEAYRLFPWSLMVDYDVAWIADTEARVRVRDCPPQTGRLKHGLPEYACKEMHANEFRAFARAVDPRIRVDCVFAPPDEHPADCFCEWRFYEVDKD